MTDSELKIQLLKSLSEFEAFVYHAHTDGIRHEVDSIRRYYNARLYKLRHVSVDIWADGLGKECDWIRSSPVDLK